MEKIARSLTELVGNTPLLELVRFAQEQGLSGRLIAKLEYFNPLGSVKDRVALAMINDAEAKGRLRPGGLIIEPTSGNTGVGLAFVAAARGYRIILTMPETMSAERRSLLRALGAEIVLTPGAEGMKGAIARAEAIRAQNPGSVILQQFENPANPAAHRILGVQNGPLVGQKLSDLPRQVASSLEVKGSSGRWRHLDEGGLHLEILSLPFREDEQQEDEGLCIIRDRTEIHQLEKSLSEVEKLAAVGTLAAGVAHEIRNPLSALRGFAQYFAKKLVGRQPDETYAQTMVREADRLNRVVTDLLYLARPRPIAPRPLELAVLVADLEHMLRLDVESGKVRFGVTLECPSVTADEDALKQALLNLILNSLEAVADLPEEERSIILASRRDDEAGGVWIMVSDNGCGMSQTVKGQAFEPFFTTRKKGTGLGLALVSVSYTHLYNFA